MAVETQRTYLGRSTSSLSRQRVYAIPDGLEIDNLDIAAIIRKRIYFDDVLLITKHRFFGQAYVISASLGAATFLVLTFVAAFNNMGGLAVFLGIIDLLILVPLIIRLIFAVDAITIFGRRSRAQIHFHLQKAKCEEVYRQLCELTRIRQEAIANEILAEEAELAAQQAAAMPVPPPAGGDVAPGGTSEELSPEVPPRAPGL